MEQQPSATVDVMVWLYTSGRPCVTIADELKVSASTVRRYLKQRGLDLGRQGARRQVTDDYVALARTMREEGHEWKFISRKIGFSIRQLQRWLYDK